MPANTTRVIIKFTDNSAIFFNDLRKFGWIKISKQPLIPKGIDVLDKRFTPILIKLLTHKTRRPVKVLLMDQDLITGIGNIYANDSLYLAGIHPQRKSNSLKNSFTSSKYSPFTNPSGLFRLFGVSMLKIAIPPGEIDFIIFLKHSV